jgi:hypothetical protein
MEVSLEAEQFDAEIVEPRQSGCPMEIPGRLRVVFKSISIRSSPVNR